MTGPAQQEEYAPGAGGAIVTERAAIMAGLTVIVSNVGAALQRLGIPEPGGTTAGEIHKKYGDKLLIALWAAWKSASDLLTAMRCEDERATAAA